MGALQPGAYNERRTDKGGTKMPVDAAARGTRSMPVLAVAAALVSGCLSPIKHASSDTATDAAGRLLLAERVVEGWWPISASAARILIDKYGVPDEVRSGSLVWRGNGPWKRTVVRDTTEPYSDPADVGVIEQVVESPLTPEQASTLAAFDRRVGFARDAREISARSDREEVNFLRLNLADDVARLRMTPEDARASYARILRLEDSGKTSPYLSGLRFLP